MIICYEVCTVKAEFFKIVVATQTDGRGDVV